MQKKSITKKIVAINILVVLLANLVLFALGYMPVLWFWIIIIMSFILVKLFYK